MKKTVNEKLREDNILLKDEVKELKEIIERKIETYNTFYKIYNETIEEVRKLQWEVTRLIGHREALLYSAVLMHSHTQKDFETIRKDYIYKDGKWIKKSGPDNVSLAT